MRLCVVSACLTLAATAAAQGLYSKTFVPPSAAEKARFDRAARDVLPSDVRAEPARHATKIVFWTGVTAGFEGGQAMVEHHYFDGVVESNGGVWLSPWGEGRFCIIGLAPKLHTDFMSERPRFVRAYGRPVMTERGTLCLQDAFVVVGDRPWTTLVMDYGPGGRDDFSEKDAAARGAVHSHPEERALTRFGYRALGAVQLGKTNWDESPLGTGWDASLELSLRASVRSEVALIAGVDSYPKFGAPRSLQGAFVYRHTLVGLGVAAGPLVDVPVRDDEPLFFGLRYQPTFGDALGSWAVSPVLGGGADLTFSPEGDVRFVLRLAVGIDGNLGAVPAARR